MWVSENKKHKLLREFYDQINREKDKIQPELLLSEYTSELPQTDTRKLTKIDNLFLNDRFLPALHPLEINGVLLLDCDLSALQLSGTTITDLFILGHRGNRQFLGDYTASIDRSIKHVEEIDFSNESLFFRLSTFHRTVEINKEIAITIDDFGENRNIPKSRADGIFLNDAVIAGCVIFMRGSARGVMAENLDIKGELLFDTVPLDFSCLTNFKIEKNGVLGILNTINNGRFKINDAIISTSHKLDGSLAFAHINFINTNFSSDNQPTYLRMSQLNDVIFKECNFANVEISQSMPTDFIWKFDSCDLTGARFQNLRGELNIDRNSADFTIENSEVALKFNTADIKIHLNNVVVINPELKTRLKAKGEKWNRVVFQVDENRSASLTGCVIEDIDLSDPNSNFKVSGSLDLSKTVFRNCNLSGISFKNCILNDAVFENCNLTRSSFDEVKETVKNLTLKGKQTRLEKVAFAGKFKNLILENISSSEIGKADFAQGEFIGGEFREVDFHCWQAGNASFLGVKFIDCRFTDCRLEGCHFDAFAGQPTEFYNCDFTPQKIIRGVTFNRVEIKGNKTQNSFAKVQFQQCHIDSISLFTNDTESETFAETTWINCTFLPGLDMSSFPFSRISGLEDIKLSKCLLNKITINCSLRQVQFSECELFKVSFGSPQRQALLENLEIRVPTKKRLQQIDFVNSKISDLKILSETTGSKRPELKLLLKDDVEIEGLQLKNLHLNEFSLSNKRVVKNLLCTDISINQGEISGGTLQQSRFERVQAEHFNLVGARFTDDCRLISTSLLVAKIESSNLFSLPAEVFNNVKITSSTIKTAIAGDFAAYGGNGLKITHSTFQKCNFNGALLQDFDFSHNHFLSDCDLKQIKNGIIGNCDFRDAALQASIDNLVLEGCVFNQTDFSSGNANEEITFKKVIFKDCQFDPQTAFARAVFQGDEQRPELFCNCRGTASLNLEHATFRELSFRKCTFSGKIYAEFSNCVLDDITFDRADIELQLYDVIATTLTFQSLTIKEKCGLVIEGQDRLAEIRKMAFIDCRIQQMDIENAAFKRIEFKDCRESSNIVFTQCSFMDRVRFMRGYPEIAENEVLIDGLDFFSCYFPQRGQKQNATLRNSGHPFLEFIGSYSASEIRNIEIRYYSEFLFSKKLRNELQQLGINPGQHIGKDWSNDLPFIDYVDEIKKLVEEGKTGTIRHETPKKDFTNILSGFKEFRYSLLSHKYLFSANANDKISTCTQHLIDALDNKGENIEPDDYFELKNRWESLMLIRVDDEELAALEGRASFKPWLQESLTGCICKILAWPLTESGKLYLDFVEFRELLTRIAQNISRYSSDKTIGIHAEIDKYNILTLFIGDCGPGWRIKDPAKLTNFEISKLFRDFTSRYTMEAYIKCQDADGSPLCLKTESFFYADYPIEKIAFDNWYGDNGTVYVMKFQLN